jgi:hypothetical protein
MKKKLSSKDIETLDIWKKIMPPDIVRIYKRMLPVNIKAPEIDADDRELLEFYDKLIPERIKSIVKRIDQLKFPIIDSKELINQMKKSNGISKIDKDILYSCSAVHFPLISDYEIKIASVIETYKSMSMDCFYRYMECKARAVTFAMKEECEERYQNCMDADLITPFVIVQLGRWSYMMAVYSIIGGPPKPWDDPPIPNPFHFY